jgi:hypothetical protein
VEKLPKRSEVRSTHYADLTGDGRPEAVVAASCRTTTGANPIAIFVYDGTRTRQPLKSLLIVGRDQFLVTAEVTIKGKTMTITSKALTSKAPRCCPDQLIVQSYTWKGSTPDVSYYHKKSI